MKVVMVLSHYCDSAGLSLGSRNPFLLALELTRLKHMVKGSSRGSVKIFCPPSINRLCIRKEPTGQSGMPAGSSSYDASWELLLRRRIAEF